MPLNSKVYVLEVERQAASCCRLLAFIRMPSGHSADITCGN